MGLFDNGTKNVIALALSISTIGLLCRVSAADEFRQLTKRLPARVDVCETGRLRQECHSTVTGIVGHGLDQAVAYTLTQTTQALIDLQSATQP